MRDPKTYYVYILTNPSQHPFYTGVTDNMDRRMSEHLDFLNDSYTARYHLTRLVYYEEFGNVREAIRREKEIKTWSRVKKIALVNTKNPKWDDLARDWGKPIPLLTPVVPPIKT
ncbi:MAG: GIY-YIG nuclease family protein [Terriglobales bacterium]